MRGQVFGHGGILSQQAGQRPALQAALQQTPGGGIQGEWGRPGVRAFLQCQGADSIQLP